MAVPFEREKFIVRSVQRLAGRCMEAQSLGGEGTADSQHACRSLQVHRESSCPGPKAGGSDAQRLTEVKRGAVAPGAGLLAPAAGNSRSRA